ncbi:unnamed protein product [Bemisia tabaci]|uniref:Chromatin-remodeling ATPase INO80 n=1 Tax=Bemisia tabaci TaxID=7038 RepID=A0A9P0ABN2_BEMTA|nr:unnamed protein product [Bemisia tabaci]
MYYDSEPAAPLHFQHLHNSLDVGPFLNYVENIFNEPIDSDGDSSDSEVDRKAIEMEVLHGARNGNFYPKSEKRSDKLRLYNLANVDEERSWIRSVLLSDSSDSDSDTPITKEDLQEMLKMHVYKKKLLAQRKKNPKRLRYQYYSTGFLANHDKFPARQSEFPSGKKQRKRMSFKKDKANKSEGNEKQETAHEAKMREKRKDAKTKKALAAAAKQSRLSKKKALLAAKTAEAMNIKRRKIWAQMAKKEIGKVQRARLNNHKEMLTSCRRVAQYCMKNWRQKAMQSQKNMKEIIWRTKRLTREMQAYWKRYDRVERETRKRMEKEAEEQRKMDVELMEAKRQQRKLNFLITQTELYAHFMSGKLGASSDEQLRILSQLDEEKNPRLAAYDDYDSETLKAKIKENVEGVVKAEMERTAQFGHARPDPELEEERPQPSLFKGTLKGYQLKGMNWIANLYDQGINGILADEMGLGKTVQSIAFLCHIAEKYSVWGPFLIISPASTLHNWQQEMSRFVPDFKVVPYWGSPQERKILRQFWDKKDLHTQEASFHVVITSYQLVITDFKYFNRIQWQYLILDEAQAIKSSSSMRWKLLLEFSCRNRLLLSGTPIQNSMAELWALLHFIMPTMFDSHDEFNEWFSKDIESHAENKASIDEKHLSRLHLILKPFMLRRIKKDVENELSDKIEIMVHCPLTTRQKMLYHALKKKIRIEDLLYSAGPYQSQNITSNLMNLVMQFRKVCNHPELFERREAKVPLSFGVGDYVVPKIVFDEALLIRAVPSLRHLLFNHLSIFAPEYVHQSIFSEEDRQQFESSFAAFSRLIDISPMELHKLTVGGILYRWLHIVEILRNFQTLQKFQHDWHPEAVTRWSALLPQRNLASELQFTAANGRKCVFAHQTVTLHCIPETMEHRVLRSRKFQEANPNSTVPESGKLELLPEFPFNPRPPKILTDHPTHLPAFLFEPVIKVETAPWTLYFSSRAAAWCRLQDERCNTPEGYACMWYGSPSLMDAFKKRHMNLHYTEIGGIIGSAPHTGWSNIIIPNKQTLVTDAGKLTVLNELLTRLKEQGHRVLIYSQMTRMIDLLEEYMWFRKHSYMRLDGSSKISERRDMVADFQSRSDIFVFLLSTRAGGLGINLTAADTVIFYDSDWNPTVDQQAMDRAHRLGQTKQVTVYRLICKGTIEERIMQRAREKSEIQRMVISGGNFKPDTLKPKEVVSLLLDDEELEKKYLQKQAERRQAEQLKEKERKRKAGKEGSRDENDLDTSVNSSPASPIVPNFEDTIVDPSTLVVKRGSKRGRPPQKRNRGLDLSLPNPVNESGIPPARMIVVKRGPGRPRLRTGGPANLGSRGFKVQRTNRPMASSDSFSSPVSSKKDSFDSSPG